MSTLQILALVAIGLSLIVTFVMKMPSADRKQARKLLASTAWLAADSAEGAVVKVQGVVRMREHGERFVSPISEDRCVVLRVRVHVRHGSDPRAKLVEDFKIMPFVLEDADGKILIDSTHAVLDIKPNKQSTRYSPRKNQLLADLGYETANSNKSEFEETMVEVGATVTIAGKLGKSDDDSTPRLVGDQDHPIAIKVDRARAEIADAP